MRVCPNCREENPERFRLCGFCGAPLTPELPATETRKVVTIVFCDLKGSTDMGERLDPESVREVMTQYFDTMRAALEEHGGKVEKYIGDAVMAVFGLPRVHEDDALRAVRAASAMQHALRALNAELDARWGVTVANRIGVNTGEVIAGDPTLGQRLVVGDAVNVAARLEQAAAPMEALIGELTYRLVRDAVEVEEVEPLTLKGKAEPVPAYRLLAIASEAAPARTEAQTLVGREAELDLLRSLLEEASADRTSRLVTVLGEAGVGKTRLIDELANDVGDEALVLRGRCLPYGKGITFWPLVEIVRMAVAVEDDDSPQAAIAKLARVAGDDDVASRVASAIGLSGEGFSLDELFWATRKLLERLAVNRPLVLIIEDVHWGEVTLLDLVEHLAAALDGPALIVAASRPELSEIRPEWGARSSYRIVLEALSEADSLRVVESRLGGELAADVAARIVEAAEGNPLFVEQLVSMLVDEGAVRRDNGKWVAAGELSELSLPPTIHALLAARLDLLGAEERAAMEPAAVIGLVFARDALAELVPEAIRDELDTHLASLARRQLIRRDDTEGAGVAYRFDHILIKDTAYHGILKRTRAGYHERFADWAERVNRERDRALEYEEFVGYHLEQAHRFLGDLGPLDEHARGLGSRAATLLASAGRRAYGRSDMAAAANLLRRTVQLLPERDAARLRMLPALGEAMTEIGELAWAELYLDEAVEAAAETNDEALRAQAELVRLALRRFAERLDRWTGMVLAEAERAIPIFERTNDNAALARAWRAIMSAHGVAYRFGDAADAALRSAEHAALAGDSRLQARAASGYAMAALYGPTPVTEAIARCEEVLARSAGDKQQEGLMMCLLAPLKAMEGEFDVARDLYSRGRALLEEVGAKLVAANTSLNAATVEILAGDPSAAEQELRATYEVLERMDETYLRPTVAAYLAHVLALQHRYEEAAELARIAEEVAAEDDVGSQSLWRSVRARIVTHERRFDEAVELAAEAVRLLRGTDRLVGQADALIVLADALLGAGRIDEAEEARAEALALYGRKGNNVALSRHALPAR